MTNAYRLLFLVWFLLLSAAAAAQALPVPDAPKLGADTYILVDQESGQVLAAKNPDQRIAPASMTKLMTTYIVFDEIKKDNLAPDEKVPISKKAWQMGGSRMFVKVGSKVSVDKLLRGVLTASGNDATVALAEYVGGTESSFVDYMNQYAARLGLTNSHFMDASGWPHKNHYMSARDIATLLGDIIADFPKLYGHYFQEKVFTYNGIKQYNRNSLLWSDLGVDGGKTGHTESAGYCLTASAKQNGMRLLSVVTHTASNNARKRQSAALLRYGFRFFETGKLFDAGKKISQIRVWKGNRTMLPVVAGGPVYVTYPRGQREALKTHAELPAHMAAPVKKGKRLGALKVDYDGDTLTSIPLYAGVPIERGGLIRRLTDEVLMMF